MLPCLLRRERLVYSRLGLLREPQELLGQLVLSLQQEQQVQVLALGPLALQVQLGLLEPLALQVQLGLLEPLELLLPVQEGLWLQQQLEQPTNLQMQPEVAYQQHHIDLMR